MAGFAAVAFVICRAEEGIKSFLRKPPLENALAPNRQSIKQTQENEEIGEKNKKKLGN